MQTWEGYFWVNYPVPVFERLDFIIFNSILIRKGGGFRLDRFCGIFHFQTVMFEKKKMQ